jgi:DNA-directed RNA polymerase sigma subunit (sigma70/sigma32)
MPRIDEFLQEGHRLLSSREKRVLVRRFCLDERAKGGTLEQVGRELGLSKERVRQVQASALSKLRKALLEGVPAS